MTDDRKTLESLIAEHGPGLKRYAASIVRNPDDAADLVQETFIRLWRKKAVLRQSEPVRPWLYRVCRNCSLNHLKKAKPMDLLDPMDGTAAQTVTEPSATPAFQAEARDEASALDDIVRRVLPPEHHEIFQLKFGQDLSYREIATIVNKDPNHVGVILHRGLQKLARAMTRASA